MDFSSRASKLSSTLSADTMGHAQAVEACRWGWSVGSHGTAAPAPHAPAPQAQARPASSPFGMRPNRATPCRGRLYHQLSCSHRIRTDLVEDCGPNCLEPYGSVSNVPFYCQECVDREAQSIWKSCEAQHNASYPLVANMTNEQTAAWYHALRQLEAGFMRDRRMYERELRSSTRPTNVCLSTQASEEEKAFAAEMDSLSLAMMSSNTSTTPESLSPDRKRVSLPSDASEQLHWGLNSLSIDRGSCGPEFSASQPSGGMSPRATTEEELWGRPGDRN